VVTKEESKNLYGADCKLRKGGLLLNRHGASPGKRPNKQDDSAASGFEIVARAGQSVAPCRDDICSEPAPIPQRDRDAPMGSLYQIEEPEKKEENS
jgi:hypothetical protein